MPLNGLDFGYGVDRFGQSFFALEGGITQIDSLVLSSALYDLLTGETPAPISLFADVSAAGVAIRNVESIFIDRSIWNQAGTVDVNFHTDTPAVASLIQGALINISAGIRSGNVSASQGIFLGNLDEYQAPNVDETLGIIRAFDWSRRLVESSPGTTMTGDVSTWLSNLLVSVGLSAEDYFLVQKTSPITISRDYSLVSFRDAMAAAVGLVNAYAVRYLFCRGGNELVILDPTRLASVAPLFELKRAIKAAPVVDSRKRFNRVPYSNYTGYARDFVTYSLTVNGDGTSNITSAAVGSTPILSGVYDDAADQAIHGVQAHDGLQNGICQTNEELLSFATSFATESQREKLDFVIPFLPFVDLGDVVKFEEDLYFVARLRHDIAAEKFWTTRLELWAA